MRPKHRNISSLVLSFFLPSILLAHGVWDYPSTPKDSVIDSLHGVELEDAYRWLENASDPRVMKWTADQNALAKDYLAYLVDRSTVISRVEELARRQVCTFDEVEGGRRFVKRKDADNDRPIYYWQDNATAPLIELINVNTLPKGVTLDFTIPSPDGTFVAVGISYGGNERPVIKIIDVSTGETLPDVLWGQKQGWPEGLVSWLSDNSGLYYSTYPEEGVDAEYWNSVYFHRLGTSVDQDVYIFGHEYIRECHHMALASPDGRYVVLDRYHGSRNEVYIQDLSDDSITPLATGFDAEYHISFAGDQIIVVTDSGAPNWKAYLVNPDKPQRQEWKLLIPEGSDTLLSVHGVAGQFYAVFLHHAYTSVKAFDASGIFINTLPLEGLGTASVSGSWTGTDVWVDFTSFAHPQSRYRYDTETCSLRLVDEATLVINPSRYTVEQVWYPSKDGTKVSMFLVYDNTLTVEGTRPTLLTGYGGFGIPVTPQFSDSHVPFLEAGGLIAIPNLRGGGEYGEKWHRAGMLDKKQNVFDDFISAAEWLISKGYSSSSRLAIRGRSNGGLLVGAAMTQRPDLFRAVLCEVPLLDMVRYHKFGYSNVWSNEYGSADNIDQFQYLLRYSPYHCVRDGVQYPSILVRASENDARTDALHARKMVARLQAADPGGNPKFLVIDKDSGHFGGTTVSEQVRQRTEGLVFVMDQLGLLTR
ncbi:MAG: prolyl oligopeptidase family serine peptidase [Chlamydiales bacterium]|nr:prolyl oligopeptidase family serine peptidase [Chlamydiales bacterium]